jgi:hypothetical protein
MRRFLIRVSAVILSFAALSFAQSAWPAVSRTRDSSNTLPLFLSPDVDSSAHTFANEPKAVPSVSVESPPVIPRMGPELALEVYRNRTVMQAEQLSSYSATTVMRAELPETKQSGEYELERQYSAPHTLAFKAVRFAGDNFVKVNVMLRLLQSEVTHVEKDDPSLNAISAANYKSSYKGTSQLNGHVVHIYQLKPRKKRAGLFKGRIYLDAYTGSIVRAEGRAVKSPSLFVKKIEFVQDYEDFGSFTLPVHIHSEAQARIVGRAIIDIYHSDYHPVSNTARASSVPTV